MDVWVAAPVLRINAFLDMLMKRGITPHPLHPAVLQRVDMDIIPMPFKIGVIADEMLPIVPLPYSPFPGVAAGVGQTFGFGSSRENPLLSKRQRVLKSLSPGGKIQTQCG